MLAQPPFNLLDTLIKVDEAIDTNADVAEHILENALDSLGLESEPPEGLHYWKETTTQADLGKAHSTIRQFFRDWSAEGQMEREVCYKPVLRDLENHFGSNAEDIRVFVPGAGLGRLVLELCLAGYHAEGNEISYHQIFASNWILNHSSRPNQFAIHPFALQFSNVKTRERQLRKVMIPDLHPGTAIAERLSSSSTTDSDSGGSNAQSDSVPSSVSKMGTMSMTSSDFLLAYSRESSKDTFDAVATVFFIDTAPNLIRYVETLHNCLRQGGIWINVGPLLWHFENAAPSDDNENENEDEHEGAQQQSSKEEHKYRDDRGIADPGRFELSEEEVILLLGQMGFTVTSHDESLGECGYIQDLDSMMHHSYRPSHWVAIKN